MILVVPDIFISYASGDRERIKPLVAALENMGWSVWWDSALLPGESWNDEIAKALDAASCVVVVWSSASIHSDWVKEESREGQRRHVLIPVLLDQVEIPLGFRGIQTANLAGWEGHVTHPEFEKVVRGVANFSPLAKTAAASAATSTAPSASAPEKPKELPRRDAADEPSLPGSDKKPALPVAKISIGAAVVVVAGIGLYFATRPSPPAPAPAPSAKPVAAVIAAGQTRVNPGDKLTYVYIPAGKFMKGCSPFDMECLPIESPAQEVVIANGFWIGQTEVTQAAYRTVTELSPSSFKGDTRPVEFVNWSDAKAYCEAVGLRLPTDSEWEYAARANDTHATYGTLDTIAWYNGNSKGSTQAVAQKTANAWGLYDTLGNVWEWVDDWYDQTQKTKTLRGGSWSNDARSARVSYRSANDPKKGFKDIGFRCAGQLP